ncbi:MAG: dethiobiotin synthase [Bdellovibrionia bacterium]
MKKGIFISGTDTGIGKTLVSALLVSSLKHFLRPAGYFKPVQTGVDPLTPSDLSTVRSLVEFSEEEWAPSVYEFPEPMAPARAAELNQASIQLDLIEHAWSQLPPRHWVVEGAGGLLVPLNPKQTIRDLIAELNLRLLLVCSTRLGTINHTLLSLEAAHAARIPVAGVVLMGSPDLGLKKWIQQFTSVPILAEIPLLPQVSPHTVKTQGPQFFPASVLEQLFENRVN